MHYFHCPTCRKRMRAARLSVARFGLPAVPTEVEYECPRCGDRWTYNRERNFAFRGWRSEIRLPPTVGSVGISAGDELQTGCGSFNSRNG
jgi:endogenous inhibitor of DNA gyrase (YacG/DUF329 family)